MTLTKQLLKKGTKASRGQKHIVGSSKSPSLLEKTIVSNVDLISEVTACCKKQCIFNNYSSGDSGVSLDRLVDFIREGREHTCLLDKESKSNVMYRLFKGTVQNFPTSGSGPTYEDFQHKWTLPLLGEINCRKCWGCYYGFSPHQLDKCSQALKKDWALTGISALYNDHTNHSYTSDNLKYILQRNVIGEDGQFLRFAGKYRFYFPASA